jgi:hypothetical protein
MANLPEAGSAKTFAVIFIAGIIGGMLIAAFNRFFGGYVQQAAAKIAS